MENEDPGAACRHGGCCEVKPATRWTRARSLLRVAAANSLTALRQRDLYMAPTNGVLGPLALLVAICGSRGSLRERAWRLVRLVRLGQPEDRFDDIPGRIRDFALYVLGQRKLIKSSEPRSPA